MTLERAEAATRAGQLATVLSSLKGLGLTDRGLFNDILRRVLEANPCLLGVWTVWEPDALDGLDAIFAGAPGHDKSGRFVPFWYRHGGRIRVEPNIDYDKPDADWYVAPTRRKAEVVIDPYEYRVAGKNLFISSVAAPIFHAGNCVGVAGFDVHMDWLFEAIDEPEAFEPIEAALGRGHVLLGDDGQVRYWSRATRRLISHYLGRASSRRSLPEPLQDLVAHALRRRLFPPSLKCRRAWTFAGRARKLVVRFTRHPQAGCGLLLVEEQIEEGWTEVDLSPREHEVGGWLGQGKSNEEIAILLGISAHTVKNHLDKIYRKLGVENRCAAAMALQRHRFAVMNGS